MKALRISWPDWKRRSRRYLDRVVEQKWINVGLRAKMGTIVVVGVAGLLTIFALLGISTARQVTGQVLSERMMLARSTAASLDSTFRHLESMLVSVADQQALRDPQASSTERNTALRASFDQVATFGHGAYLFDTAGRLLASTTGEDRDMDWANVTAVQNALHGGRLNLAVVNANPPRAVMAVPVLDESGAPIGALAVLLDLTLPGITPFDHSFDLGETGSLEVVDANGVVLVSTRADDSATSDQVDLLRRLFVAGEPKVETCVGCDAAGPPASGGQVMAFVPMAQAPWGVVIRQDADEVFAPVRRLTLLTLMLGIAAIVGALGLVWVTTNSVIAPVQLLTDAARRIADGDLTTPICCYRGDEIGEMAESFDAMRAQLRSSIDEIRAWNRELDARVQERTQAALDAQHEAQRARDDLRAIIDSLSDELVVVGLDRHIQQVNKAAQRSQTNGNEIIGQLCYQVLHPGQPCSPPERECPIPKVLTTRESAKVTHIRQDRDGQERYLDIVASPMRDPTGHITRVIELRREVTAEKRTEQALIRRNEQLSILNTVATTVNQSLDLEELLGKALDEILRLTEVDAGAIFLQEETLGSLELLAHRGLSEEAARVASRFGMLDGACGGVLETGQVAVVPDLSRYRGRRAASLRREKLNALVHVPLTAKGSTLGSMCVGTRCQREFDADDQGLLVAIGSQIAVAIENARLYSEVQRKERMRGELLKKVITAQEEERKRIARMLHDDTSQSITALLYAAEEAMEVSDGEEVKRMLASMRDLAGQTLDGVHQLILGLRPTMLDHLGLVPALRSFAQSRLEPAGVRVTVEESPAPRRLPAEVETALFRAVQEAITNIARHAAARNVHISFDFEATKITVRIEDDGIGFDMVEATLSPNSGRGLGLMGMRERVEVLGGEIDIDTAPGYGVKIRICVPTGKGNGTHV
jgi:PAS domain S-box-containing protein